MNKKLKLWLPTIIFGVLTVFFAVYYGLTDNRLKTVYIQLALCLFVPAIFPVLGIITKKPFPVALTILSCYLVVVGIYFAKAMNFYGFVPEYDKFLHTGFGLVGSAMVYTLLMRWGGDKLSPAGIAIIVFLGVMGIGSIWEIIEYVCSKITHEDPQRVLGVLEKIAAAGSIQEAWKQGINPLEDTMWDLIVTVIGSAVFIIFYVIDRVCGGKLCKKLFTVKEPAEKVGEAENEAAEEQNTQLQNDDTQITNG